ncbi:MAG: ABC transporter permease, partial [Acidothermus cellulolyticus]|nr:ABC transporter permease [Acidothermus cellulolyticus]
VGVENVSWSLFLTPLVLALLLIFASGIGLLFALFNVFYRDISYLVGVVLQLIFYATPVIWAPQQLLGHAHGHLAVRVLAINPLYQFVEGFRDVLWTGTVPSASRWGWMILAAAISIGVGLTVFIRGSRDVSEEL